MRGLQVTSFIILISVFGMESPASEPSAKPAATEEPVASESVESNPTSPNHVSFNLGGPGIGLGFNYGRKLAPRHAIDLGYSYFSFNAGGLLLGMADTGANAFYVHFLPVSYSFLIPMKKPKRNFEIMAGVTPFFATGTGSFKREVFVWPFAGGGFRLWPLNGGFHFRADGLFFINSYASSTSDSLSKILPYLGVSFGYAF
jgi:hypothetical protein